MSEVIHQFINTRLFRIINTKQSVHCCVFVPFGLLIKKAHHYDAPKCQLMF